MKQLNKEFIKKIIITEIIKYFKDEKIPLYKYKKKGNLLKEKRFLLENLPDQISPHDDKINVKLNEKYLLLPQNKRLLLKNDILKLSNKQKQNIKNFKVNFLNDNEINNITYEINYIESNGELKLKLKNFEELNSKCEEFSKEKGFSDDAFDDNYFSCDDDFFSEILPKTIHLDTKDLKNFEIPEIINKETFEYYKNQTFQIYSLKDNIYMLFNTKTNDTVFVPKENAKNMIYKL